MNNQKTLELKDSIAQKRDYLVQVTMGKYDSEVAKRVFENEFKSFPEDILRIFEQHIRTEKELSRQEGIESIVLGAIPETTDYANGWNDCRKTLGRIKAELKGKNE